MGLLALIMLHTVQNEPADCCCHCIRLQANIDECKSHQTTTTLQLLPTAKRLSSFIYVLFVYTFQNLLKTSNLLLHKQQRSKQLFSSITYNYNFQQPANIYQQVADEVRSQTFLVQQPKTDLSLDILQFRARLKSCKCRFNVTQSKSGVTNMFSQLETQQKSSER